MTNEQLAALRLRNQRLVGPPLPTAVDVVRWLGAVQAQELAVARWSLGQRTRAATEAAVERALADGSILRTHVLRPTWHFVLPEDVRWMIRVSAARVKASLGYYDRQLALGATEIARAERLIARALEGGGAMTRAELAAVLARGRIVAQGQRLGHLMMHAELDLVVCSGAPRGKQQTYALLDERAPADRPLARDEALRRLARRYFAGRGPATVKDFAWWAGVPGGEAKSAVAALTDGKELESIVAGGRRYWLAPGGGAARRAGAARVHLLQGYDEYIIAYAESRDLLAMAPMPGVVARNQIPFAYAVMLDGRVVGHWRRVPSPRAAALELYLAAPLTAAQQRALQEEIARYAEFVGLPARATVSATPLRG